MGFVYFIREKKSDAYKIGCSASREGVNARLCGLQVGDPRELELFALIECVDWVEKESEIQDTWDSLNIRGEWYKFTESQVLVLLKAYGGYVVTPAEVRTYQTALIEDDLKSVCKKKLDGYLDISIRQISDNLKVKKWQVEAMLKELSNNTEDVNKL